METINLGRVAFVYKGDYSAVTSYNKMDVVFDGESSFVSQIDNNVGNPLVNGLNWKYLSRGNNLELQEAKQDIATLETDLNLDEYTIAEAFNLLYRKIVSLETIIANGIFKNLQVDNLTTVNAFNYNGAPLIVIGSTAPASAPDFVGQTYINTTAPGTVYSAKGTAYVSDWKQTSN